MKLISTLTQAQREAEAIVDLVNDEFSRRVSFHIRVFRQFWAAGETPDARLEAMGDRAGLFLATASANLEHIAKLAAMQGMQLDEVIDPALYIPPRQFIVAEDGTATLDAPPEGHDAWGNPPPPPEPEIEPEEPATP